MTALQVVVAVLVSGVATACTQHVEVFIPSVSNDAQVSDAASESDAASDASVNDAAVDAGDDAAFSGGDDLVDAGVSIAAFSHTCALVGAVPYCWGPLTGQWATDASERGLVSPHALSDGFRYADICAGEEHACALRTTGQVACWGGNDFGQLGTGEQAPKARPTPIASEMLFRSLACGGTSSCALTFDGALYCWGSNAEGQLAVEDLVVATKPRRVGAAAYKSVALGQAHVCAITTEGLLHCWGRNSEGALGLGPDAEIQIRTPTPVDTDHRYLKVAAGMGHTCGVRDDRSIACWGRNQEGRLGIGEMGTRLSPPTAVSSAVAFEQVRLSWFHSCALSVDGDVYCWGRNAEGALGTGDIDARLVPTRVDDDGFTDLTVGRFHTCARKRSEVYCWGINESYQLGLADTERRYIPTLVRIAP